MAKRKKYSEEFKREAVALTRQPGASVAQIAQDIKGECQPAPSLAA